MGTHKLGLLIGETGTTSMTLLASDPAGRAACLVLYQQIEDEVAEFEARLRARLAPGDGRAGPTRPRSVRTAPRAVRQSQKSSEDMPPAPKHTTSRASLLSTRPVAPAITPVPGGADVDPVDSSEPTTPAPAAR